jgi:hypothetical protein
MAAVAREQLAWNKERFAEVAPTLKTLADQQIRVGAANETRSTEQWQSYKDLFAPLEKTYAQEAANEVNEAQQSAEADKARAATAAGYEAQRGTAARKAGRIGQVPHQVGVPVNTFWDLGANDTTAIWFHQAVGIHHRFIYAYEASGEGLSHYVGKMQRLAAERGYVYGRHFLPHDAEQKTLASMSNKDGRSVRELMETMGVRDIVVVPRIEDVTIGIELTRQSLSRSWFDAEGCEAALDALGQYHKVYDESGQTFRLHPHHDWSSNYADAFRQFAQGYEPPSRDGGFKRKHHRSARTI